MHRYTEDHPDIDALRMHLHNLTAEDLVHYVDLVPQGAQEMIDILGVDLALKIFRTWGGALIFVPPRNGIPRQAAGHVNLKRLKMSLTSPEVQALCTAWGGEALHVPVFRSLFGAKRRGWIRASFDARCSRQHCTKAEAIHQIGIVLVMVGLSMTSRQISSVLDDPDEIHDGQSDLFETVPSALGEH